MTKPAEPMAVQYITSKHLANEAIGDLVEGFRKYGIWTTFAVHEIKQRFRRSIIGPLWLTLSMGVMIGALGLVFSTLFDQDISQTLPYIAVGVIFWGLLTSVINEGAQVFIGNEGYIRNVPLPISVHFYRMLARNLIILVFNMAIYVVVLIAFRVYPDWHILLFLPGFALFLINVAWMGMAAAILSTRYRDIPQVIGNVVQVVFFVTPVFWSAANLPKRPAFVEWNPFHHMLELVRAPLINHEISFHSWIVALAMAVGGIVGTAYLFRRAYARIAYWV